MVQNFFVLLIGMIGNPVLGRPTKKFEVLEAIAALGLRVFDVREMGNLEALADLASTAATLPPPR